MQRQRLLSDRQQFQREQMKLLELRSPTTLTPQTPLPLTPSARQFVVPTTKLAPPPTTSDTTKETSVTGEEGVAKPFGDAAADVSSTGNSLANNSLDSKQLPEANAAPSIDLPESGGGAELLPPVDEHITNTTTANANAEDLFPIDFPNSDHHGSPDNEDHMISEGNEGAPVQQSMEFESSNQMSADIPSPDPTAFHDFGNMGQFDQSDDLPETSQSNQLDKLAEELDQLPQQPVPLDDNRQTDDVQQLEELSTEN